MAAVSKGTASIHRHVSGYLLRPLLVRVDSEAGNINPAALQMDKKQHVIGHQSSQRDDLDRKEVGAGHHRKVSANEFCPRRRALALRRWRHAMATQNIADRLIRNLVAQIRQSSSDRVWGAKWLSMGFAVDNYRLWLWGANTGPGRSGGFIALTSRRRGALAGMMAAGALGVAFAGLSHCGHFQAKGAANRGKPLSAAAVDCAAAAASAASVARRRSALLDPGKPMVH
jgi:hypothetical protein